MRVAVDACSVVFVAVACALLFGGWGGGSGSGFSAHPPRTQAPISLTAHQSVIVAGKLEPGDFPTRTSHHHHHHLHLFFWDHSDGTYGGPLNLVAFFGPVIALIAGGLAVWVRRRHRHRARLPQAGAAGAQPDAYHTSADRPKRTHVWLAVVAVLAIVATIVVIVLEETVLDSDTSASSAPGGTTSAGSIGGDTLSAHPGGSLGTPAATTTTGQAE